MLILFLLWVGFDISSFTRVFHFTFLNSLALNRRLNLLLSQAFRYDLFLPSGRRFLFPCSIMSLFFFLVVFSRWELWPVAGRKRTIPCPASPPYPPPYAEHPFFSPPLTETFCTTLLWVASPLSGPELPTFFFVILRPISLSVPSTLLRSNLSFPRFSNTAPHFLLSPHGFLGLILSLFSVSTCAHRR